MKSKVSTSGTFMARSCSSTLARLHLQGADAQLPHRLQVPGWVRGTAGVAGVWGCPPLDLRHGHLLKLLKLVLCVEPVADTTALPAGPACTLPRLGLGHTLHSEHLQATVCGENGPREASPRKGSHGFTSVGTKQCSSEPQ